MSKEQILELTNEYNEKRKLFSFPTVSASESGIKSILKLYPELEEMDRTDMIRSIAQIIYNLAFN